MANTIIHKKSSVASKVPLEGDLSLGELAVNTTDGLVFMKKGDNTIVAIGAGGSFDTPVNDQTASYTTTIDDANAYIRMDSASANTVTIPDNTSVAYAIGTSIIVRQVGDGTTTLVPAAGVTIYTPEGLSLDGIDSTVKLVKVSTNAWDLSGDIAPYTYTHPFSATLVPVDLVASCGITCTGDYEVDWGDGSFIQYASGVTASVVPTSDITVRNQELGADVTWSRFTTNTYSSIDITAGTSLTSLDNSCQNLSAMTSFNAVGTGNVLTFAEAWRSCSGLTSFPLIDTSSATDCGYTWYDCSGLTSFPLLDMALNEDFYGTWESCSSLITFPAIDTSAGTDHDSAWQDCTSLISHPGCDVSNTDYTTEMFDSCENLLSVGPIIGAPEAYMDETFEYCESLICITSIDTTNAYDTDYIFDGCDDLVNPTSAEVSLIEGGYAYVNANACP